MSLEIKPPCRLSSSFVMYRRESSIFDEAKETAYRELYVRRDIGIKLLEWLQVDQPITICLNRTCTQDFRMDAIVTTFDLKIMAVERMRVFMHELDRLPVTVHPPKQPGVLGRLWDGWKKHVDQCRESLGG